MADFHLWATYAIILATVAAYAWDRWPIETVALASLAAFLALFAVLPFHSANGMPLSSADLISGFANPALATVLALLIIGQGLFATDAMDHPARMIAGLGGSGAVAMGFALVAAGTLSAVLNNTPVVVIFIPVLATLANQRKFPVEHALMPLSFMSLLGGNTTLIGSSTNLLVAGIAARSGTHVGFFDITVPGLILFAVGTAYVLLVIPRLVKTGTSAASDQFAASGHHFIGEIRIAAGHPFLGVESRSGLFPGLQDITPRLVIRRGITITPPFEDITLSEGDRLVVGATRRALARALSRGSAQPYEADGAGDGDPAGSARRADYHLAEVVVTPGSRHAGRTVRHAGIGSIHGVDVIGVQRKSRMGRTPLAEIRLEAGDTLLVGGTSEDLKSLRDSHDIILLESSAEALPQTRKASIAIAIFAGVVVSSALGLVPIVAASIIGAFLMVAFGCLTIHQAARAFDRRIFLLVGASIAAAVALERTGGAALIAQGTAAALHGASLPVILSTLFLVVAIMTNLLTHSATAVLFTPIALQLADKIHAPRMAFIAAVIFASNASFATPIGHQTNLLVMGPGGYRFADFMRVGGPLIIIMWLTFSLAGPWYYGL